MISLAAYALSLAAIFLAFLIGLVVGQHYRATPNSGGDGQLWKRNKPPADVARPDPVKVPRAAVYNAAAQYLRIRDRLINPISDLPTPWRKQ